MRTYIDFENKNKDFSLRGDANFAFELCVNPPMWYPIINVCVAKITAVETWCNIEVENNLWSGRSQSVFR